MSLSQQLTEYIFAAFTGIWIESHEHDDALREIAQMCRDQQWRLATWDVDQGLQIPGADQPAAAGADPLAAVRSVNALADADGSALLVLQNFHRFTQLAEIAMATENSHASPWRERQQGRSPTRLISAVHLLGSGRGVRALFCESVCSCL